MLDSHLGGLLVLVVEVIEIVEVPVSMCLSVPNSAFSGSAVHTRKMVFPPPVLLDPKLCSLARQSSIWIRMERVHVGFLPAESSGLQSSLLEGSNRNAQSPQHDADKASLVRHLSVGCGNNK